MEQATKRGLDDPDPLVRVAALRGQLSQPLEVRWRRAGPLLSDPVRAVRIEAATLLADQKADLLSPADRARLEAAWAEYEASQILNADRPEGRANLGNFLLRRGKPNDAEAEYLAGLKLDPMAIPLYVNLADFYRLQGREAVRGAAFAASNFACARLGRRSSCSGTEFGASETLSRCDRAVRSRGGFGA